MTDHFALLGQPRSAWLDPAQLKEAFHARTYQAHPDGQGDADQFAALNEAYQVLRDPKRRLQHLLALAGESLPAQSAAVPENIAALFPAVAGLVAQASDLIEKASGATSTLARSLLRRKVIETNSQLELMLERLDAMTHSANEQLRDAFTPAHLRDLCLQFSYLSRWTNELRERQLQLSL